MVVYLIHFDQKIGNPDNPHGQAQHYLGVTNDLDERICRHRTGNGSKIMAYVARAGIHWDVVRTWDDGSPDLEKRLKSWHKTPRLCPICRKRTHVK